MSNGKTLVTLSGSLRAESYNHKVARQAQQIAINEGQKAINIHLSEYPLPIFNEDIEGQEVPRELTELRKIFSEASSLVIASPEYNGSFSAALKNLIDWLSRPAKEESSDYRPAFDQYTVALVSASPGQLGGLRGLSHLRELMTNMGSIVIPQQLSIGAAYEAFDENGELIKTETKERLENIVKTLIETDRRLKD